MKAIHQISALLIATGLALFVALGNILYASNDYELLSLVIVCTNVIVLFGGLQCWLVPVRRVRVARPRDASKGDAGGDDGEHDIEEKIAPPATRPSSIAVGWTVCGLVGLFVFATVSLSLLYLVFFKLQVNAAYRVSFDRPVSRSSNIRQDVLPNGLRYSVTHSEFKREKFSLLLRVDTGSFDDPDGQLGLAHLAEHMALDASELHQQRQGIRSMFEALGSSVRTHTSHRTTTFLVTDLPFSQETLTEALTLLKDMTLRQRPTDEALVKEKSVLIGEERVLNSTRALLRRTVFCNHFGEGSRICKRFPYGAGTSLDDLSVAQVSSFFAQWYHPSRIELFVAGDFGKWKVEDAIKSVWSTASRGPSAPAAGSHGQFVQPQPTEPFLIRAIKGVEGFDFNLLVSTAYNGHMRTANQHRTKTLNSVFYGLLLNQYLGRMLEFDYTEHEVQDNIDLNAEVVDEYQFDQTVHSLHLQVSGHPEKGAWRRYLEVFFVELRRLAEHGPDQDVLLSLMRTASEVLEAKKAYSAFEDSGHLTEAMMGNHDPQFVYMDAQQEFQVNAPFLNRGFLRSARLHIQSEAQFLWRALYQVVTGTQLTRQQDEYASLVPSTPSLTIFVGETDSDAVFVGRDEVRSLVTKVMEAVLVPHKQVRSVIEFADVFINSERISRFWDPTREVTDSSDEVEERLHLVREHLQRSVSSVGDDDTALDGLPASGSLVDETKLIYHPIPRQAGADTADPPPPSSLTPEDVARRHNEYELVESYPLTGVKRYRLSNGLHVNLKARLSGHDSLPCDAPGVVELSVVSLGGRATQPPSLKGACELVDMNTPSGFIVEYWSQQPGANDIEEKFFDIKDVQQYLQHTGLPHIRCEREHLIIHKRLHSKCINYPHVRDCDRIRSHYLKKLESVRLAMSPVYDANSVERASEKFEGMLAAAERKADPVEYIKWRTFWDLQRPWLESHQANASAHVSDQRAAIVTPQHLLDLDPERVGLWVREQFTVDRTEVNVVGDFDEHHLLHQLNKMLGTMVMSRSKDRAQSLEHSQSPRAEQRVGFDIYKPADERHFLLELDETSAEPAENNLTTAVTNCSLPSLHPGRATLAMHVLTNADASAVRGHQKAAVASASFQRELLNSLRKDKGYVYKIESKSFTSHVYARFGYYQLQWVVGSKEEIVQSRAAIHSILSAQSPFSRETFDSTKRALISSLKGELQSAKAWLPVLQGLSLRPPVWQRHDELFKTLRDLAQTDVLGRVEALDFEDVRLFFLQHLLKSKPVHVGIVETVAKKGDNTTLGGEECRWRWKSVSGSN